MSTTIFEEMTFGFSLTSGFWRSVARHFVEKLVERNYYDHVDFSSNDLPRTGRHYHRTEDLLKVTGFIFSSFVIERETGGPVLSQWAAKVWITMRHCRIVCIRMSLNMVATTLGFHIFKIISGNRIILEIIKSRKVGDETRRFNLFKLPDESAYRRP